MAYDLRKLARQTGRRRGRVTIARAEVPLGLEQDLLAILMQPTKLWRARISSDLLPAYQNAMQGRTRDQAIRDDDPDSLESQLAAITDEVSRLALTLTPAMRTWAIRLERWHRESWKGKVKTAVGVDLSTLVSMEGVATDLDAVTHQLAGLVKGMTEAQANTIRNHVWASFTAREPRRELSKRLFQEGLVTTKTRAQTIARDQTTKLAGILDETRQMEAGLTTYTWRHSRKRNARPHHVARDGQVFQWKKPPYDGHPGFAINCGCKAEARLDWDD